MPRVSGRVAARASADLIRVLRSLIRGGNDTLAGTSMVRTISGLSPRTTTRNGRHTTIIPITSTLPRNVTFSSKYGIEGEQP